jgi:hypothetical protein
VADATISFVAALGKFGIPLLNPEKLLFAIDIATPEI